MLPTLSLFALLSGCKSEIAPSVIDDDTVPELSMDTHGYFHGSEATVEGRAVGLSAITVNGEEAFLNGDAWQASVALERGVNLVEVRGTDVHGDPHLVTRGVLSGTFADADDPIEEALVLRLNQSGIDAAMDITTDLLMAQDIEGLITGLGPVYEGSYSVLGFEAGSLSVSILDVDFYRPTITADPETGVLEMDASVPYFQVELAASGAAIGIDFDETVTLEADRIDFGLDLSVEVDGGDLHVGARNPQLALVGFDFDVSLIPNMLEGFFTNQVRGIIEERVVDTLDELLPTLLEDRLSDLQLAYDTELLGRSVAVEGFLDSITVDDFGIELHTDLAIDAERSADVGTAGYLSADSLPSQPSLTDDLALTVSDDLLNNLLFQAWRADLLSLDLDSARGELDADLLEPLGAAGSARVTVTAATPPVLIERNDSAMVQITELLVHVETPGGANGELLDVAVTAFVDLDLVVDRGVLKLSLNEPEILVDVRDNDWGLADNTLSNLLAEQLPIDTLLAVLGEIEVPLPSVAGISLRNATTARDGTGSHTSVGANL